MALDVPTIFLTSALIALLVCGIQLLAYARLQAPALGYWASANLAFGISCAIFFLRGQLPLFASALIANSLIFLGLGLLSTGIRVFDGRRPRTDSVIWGTAVGAGLLALSLALGDDTALRVTIASLGIAFWTLVAGVTLLRSPRGTPLFSRLVSAVLFVGFAVLHIARAIAVQIGALSPDAVLNGPLQALSMLAGLTLGVAWSLGSLFMVLDRMASHDDLTDLVNRRTTLLRARLLMEEAVARRRPLSVLMADLDHFKSVNDRFGHQLGDAVLRSFAHVGHQALRAGDLMGRYGGEEFCVVLPGADMHAARVVAERLRSIAEKTLNEVEGQPTRVTITIGTASFDGNDGALADVARLIKAADDALYEAKMLGRNRVVSASPAGSSFLESGRATEAFA